MFLLYNLQNAYFFSWTFKNVPFGECDCMIFVADKILLGFNILRYMSKADRFNMAVMFLSTSDLSKIKKIIEELDLKVKDSTVNVTAKELTDLKKAYKVT